VAAIVEDKDSAEVVEEALGILGKADTEATLKETTQVKLGTMQAVSPLTLLIVPIIKALLSALRAIGETRIEVLRGSILTLTRIGATSLTSSMLKACATGTPIGSCALDPGTQTLRRCSFGETRPG
jgi:hypothetical protein